MFCKNCGKALVLNPDKTCVNCGGFVLFCRNCGKGLILNPDKTCAGCGSDPIKTTSFCRYCGKVTGPEDLNCQGCGAVIRTVPGRDDVAVKKSWRRVWIGMAVGVLATCVVLFSFRSAIASPFAAWIATFRPPVVKPDFSKNETINLVIENGKFYPDKIYAEAGANLYIHFTNKDVGVEHNFVLYREMEGYPLAMSIGEHVVGPGTAVYKVKVPRVGPDGAYWFACDNHYATEQGFFYPTWPAQ